MPLQMQHSCKKEFSFYQKNVNVAWIQHEHGSRSFQEWMGFLFSWTSKVILNIAAFIVFYCLHDCLKGFLCFSQKIMQRIFCDVFLEIIVYAQTKMLFDEWIDVWYSIHNASFRVESFAKRWIFQPAAENNEWCTQ